MCVLFVDDEPMLRELVAEFLKEHGLTVITARDGSEAASLIDNPPQPFCVLLTDFTMPGPLDGFDVARRMRTSHPHVPIFIVTGRPDALNDARGNDLDYTYLPKPFDMGALAKQLARF